MRSTRSRCSDHFIHKAQDNLKLNATSWVGRTYRFTRSQTRGFTCVAMFLFLNRYNWLVVPMAMERGRIIMLLLIFRVRVVKSRVWCCNVGFFFHSICSVRAPPALLGGASVFIFFLRTYNDTRGRGHISPLVDQMERAVSAFAECVDV